tara:strand:- start:725 stop:1276 length:552 start_codon:yes stop_codon:yes gene_type:complete
MKKVFRFDDICINADMKSVNKMVKFLNEEVTDCEILFGISPLVHDMISEDEIESQRIFPKILNAHSDFRKFYLVDHCGLPKLPDNITRAGHGLIHVDHRLLSKEAQEMSILTSCSLAKARTFIPPFNKWNTDTEEICKEHQIRLIKFEDGWKCMEYNKYDPKHNLWYLHHREFTLKQFKEWFE